MCKTSNAACSHIDDATAMATPSNPTAPTQPRKNSGCPMKAAAIEMYTNGLCGSYQKTNPHSNSSSDRLWVKIIFVNDNNAIDVKEGEGGREM